MPVKASTAIALGLALAMLVPNDAAAQSEAALPAPEPGAEVANFGTVPFVATETLLLRPDQKAAFRTLEDRHVKELRDLEDKFDGELRALRQRHAQERETLKHSFRR